MRSVRGGGPLGGWGILLALSCVTPAYAQQPQPVDFYVTGSLAIPIQGGPTEEQRGGELYLIPFGPGGTTIGWKAGIGFFFVPRTSIDVELVGTGRMGPLWVSRAEVYGSGASRRR